MARQWRCAVIGTGMVGEWHVKTIPKIPGCILFSSSPGLVAPCGCLPGVAKGHVRTRAQRHAQDESAHAFATCQRGAC